jgi:hypothetical protein
MLTKVTFRLAGYEAALTAAAVTRRLGLQPAAAFEANTPVSRRKPPRTRGYSLWLISSSPHVEPDIGVGEHLRRLLAILEPVSAPLWELAGAGYEANWYCFAASHATEHAMELDRPILKRLLALPGDLWLDVCGDGSGDPQ